MTRGPELVMCEGPGKWDFKSPGLEVGVKDRVSLNPGNLHFSCVYSANFCCLAPLRELKKQKQGACTQDAQLRKSESLGASSVGLSHLQPACAWRRGAALRLVCWPPRRAWPAPTRTAATRGRERAMWGALCVWDRAQNSRLNKRKESKTSQCFLYWLHVEMVVP